MKRIVLIFILFPIWLNAQLVENFSDGNFTENPTWSGTPEKYIINTNFQLQLNSTEAATTWLSTPYTNPGGNVEWRFWIKLAFAPSGSNYSDVYLISNQANLSGALNGYFLRFGESGSNDAIELFKKQGTQITSICRGPNGSVAASFAYYIRVVRSSTGVWQVFADRTGTGIYGFEATGTDNTYAPGGYFGFYGIFTVSNSTKMYYDDVLISQEIVDNEPPQLLSATATDPFTIQVVFNEGITSQTLLDVNNYVINEGIGTPTQVTQGATSAQSVLQLGSQLENGKTYTLIVSNVKDIAGNVMSESYAELSYYEANQGDVVINEIMADPSPVVGLPDWEFIELHNTTNIKISLNNWKLIIGTSEKVIGQVQIEPNGFVILAHENAQFFLQNYGTFFGFTSFQLTNSGTNLKLNSSQGIEVSSVTYADTWYNDNAKKEGGWTLEQIDPTNPCGGTKNWTASNSSTGGTPGQQNSVFAISDARPKPEKMKLISNNAIQIWFDQSMDLASLGNMANYSLNPGNILPQTATISPTDATFVELTFETPFEAGTLYKLTISTQVLNCAGREVAPETFIEFGIPDIAEANDLVINEILFNPLNGGQDFVEIYNRSNKIINLEDIQLGAVRQTIPNPPDTTLKDIIASTWLLLPQTYVVLTVSITSVTDFYYTPTTENFIQMASFPTYSNEFGTAILKTKTGIMIDAFSYDEKMHFPLLNIIDGVSLERVSPEIPSSDRNNWHSASETVGFATPGYKNSVDVEPTDKEGEIVVNPELFSPDGDGRDDVTTINYTFERADNTMNMYIYNASGQKIRHLIKSMLIGQKGATSWDGLDDSGNRVPVGIYVVYTEIFDLDGNVSGFKNAVVVATR